MEIVETTVSVPDGEELLLKPIGDVQAGVPAADMDRLQAHIARRATSRTRYIGMGDYVDMASPSNRRILRASKLYEPVHQAIAEKAVRDIDEFMDAVDGTAGNWLGMLRGHHYNEFGDGTTSDTRICERLGAPFLGDCGMVRLKLQGAVKALGSFYDLAMVSVDIWVHHGRGSGMRVGSPLNVLEDIAGSFDADIYLMGHQHKRVAANLDHLYVDEGGQLRHRAKLIACTGSFLRGYLQGAAVEGLPTGTYVEKGMLRPLALGGVTIKLRPHYETGKVDIAVEYD